MNPEYLLWGLTLLLILITIRKRDYELGLAIFNSKYELKGIQIGLIIITKLLVLSLGYKYLLAVQLANWIVIVHLLITTLYSLAIMLVLLGEPIRNGVIPKMKYSNRIRNQILIHGFFMWGIVQLILVFQIIKMN